MPAALIGLSNITGMMLVKKKNKVVKKKPKPFSVHVTLYSLNNRPDLNYFACEFNASLI